MRRLISLLAASTLGATIASAEGPMSQEEIVEKAQTAFSKSKNNPKAMEGIRLWCKDSIVGVTILEGVKLKTKAIDLMKANKLDEANALLKQAESERALTETIAEMSCRPR